MQRVILIIGLLMFSGLGVFAQNDNQGGSVTGNFKLDVQTYTPDDKIGADTVAERMLS
jgi:hypothetical protein